MVFQRDILAPTNRDVGQCVSPQDKDGGGQCCPTDRCVVQLEADQSCTKGIDNVEQDLVECIIARLTRTDSGGIIRGSGSGKGRLIQTP